MIFYNYKQIATSPLRKKILDIFDNTMALANTRKIVRNSVCVNGDYLVVKGERFSIKNKRIFVVGMGKVSAYMALALEETLGVDKIVDGIVVSPQTTICTKKIKIHIADHPIPSARSVAGARAIRSLKKRFKINEKDLIIALVSGGGSSLVVEPVRGVSLADKQKMTKILLDCGANGYDNTRIKAVLSRVKGGGLSRYFFPTPIISLIISDDNGLAGNEMTASGPFSNDRPKFAEALGIISKYGIKDKIPLSIYKLINGPESEIVTQNVKQFILLDNTAFIKEVESVVKKEKMSIEIHSNMHGETQEVANKICKHIQGSSHKGTKLFVYGGETTVTLCGNTGIGGRNQEFVVTCLEYFLSQPVEYQWCIASIATDGVDYIKESCGGIVDRDSVIEIKKKRYCVKDFLLNHNTHSLLKLINGNLVVKKEATTNLSDVVLCIISK